MVLMNEGAERDKMINALKAHCRLDTLAMVEIDRVFGNFLSSCLYLLFLCN